MTLTCSQLKLEVYFGSLLSFFLSLLPPLLLLSLHLSPSFSFFYSSLVGTQSQHNFSQWVGSASETLYSIASLFGLSFRSWIFLLLGYLQNSDRNILCWVERTIVTTDCPKQVPNQILALLHIGINSHAHFLKIFLSNSIVFVVIFSNEPHSLLARTQPIIFVVLTL